MIPVVRKPYLCWRAPDSDAELFTDLFRYRYHKSGKSSLKIFLLHNRVSSERTRSL